MASEQARLKHNQRNREYWARRVAARAERRFEAHAYPLRLRLQRILCSIRYRCAHRDRYVGRGIQNFLTYDDILTIWNRDGAEQMRRPSIDRIDNDGHYELSNVRFIELADNIRRGVEVRVSEKYLGTPLAPGKAVA